MDTTGQQFVAVNAELPYVLAQFERRELDLGFG